jgi:hypothetical protein
MQSRFSFFLALHNQCRVSGGKREDDIMVIVEWEQGLSHVEPFPNVFAALHI